MCRIPCQKSIFCEFLSSPGLTKKGENCLVGYSGWSFRRGSLLEGLSLRISLPEDLSGGIIRRFWNFQNPQRLWRCRKFWRFRIFCIDSESVFCHYSRFLRTGDATRSAKSRTFVFAGRRSTSEGSQRLRRKKKSLKIDKESFRCRFAQEPHGKNTMFPLPDATWH